MRISWIEETVIACGGIPVSRDNAESLREQGIQAIVTLTEHPLTEQKELGGGTLADMGFEVLHVPVVDQHPPTREQAQQVLDFLEQMRAAGKAVYLHCHAGVGRTGTMLHAVYLLSGMSFDEAKATIEATRPASQFFMLSPEQQRFLESLAASL